MLPHDEMEECQVAFECTPPVLELTFRNWGEGRGRGAFNEMWEDMYCRVHSLAHKGFHNVI